MNVWDVKIHCEEVYTTDENLIYEQYFRDQDEDSKVGIKKGEFGVFYEGPGVPEGGALEGSGEPVSGDSKLKLVPAERAD